jgi:uncharacterized protein (TIGR02145 family)
MKRIIVFVMSFAFLMNLSAQDKFIDTRDGNTYKTVRIAGVTWMAENLKYNVPGNGTTWFDNDKNNMLRYGALYNWNTAMKVCPDGWHLPTGMEFRNLLDYYEIEEAWEKTESGPASFRIQLAGMQDYEGTFTELDESGYYWTSTEYDKDASEYFSYLVINGKPVIDISRRSDISDIHGAEKSSKYSVRCVKN